jgi:hypothetical protein
MGNLYFEAGFLAGFLVQGHSSINPFGTDYASGLGRRLHASFG